jgi:hypothetical protein
VFRVPSKNGSQNTFRESQGGISWTYA